MKLFKKNQKPSEPRVDVSKWSLLDWKLCNEIQLQGALEDALSHIEKGAIDSAKFHIHRAIEESKRMQYQIEYYLKD